MLAQLLLLQNQAKRAVAEYETVLKVAPNRFNALYAQPPPLTWPVMRCPRANYFRKLTQVAVGDERPELVTARKKITLAMK